MARRGRHAKRRAIEQPASAAIATAEVEEEEEANDEVETEERKRKVGENNSSDGNDRLGALPDDILLHIMSFLPIHASTRTAAISRRWRRLPPLLPSVQSVDLDPVALGINVPKFPTGNQYNDGEQEGAQQRQQREKQREVHKGWVKRASEVLRSHHAVIRSCRIVDRTRTWKNRSERYMIRWMDELAHKGIQSLTLETDHIIRLPEPCFPRSKSLTSLQMVGLNLLYRRPLHIGCPAICTLKLVHVRLQEDMLTSIMSACIHIQTLHLESCYRLGRISIGAPNSLRCIKIRPYMDTKCIQVVAPNLTTVTLRIVPWVKSFGIHAPQVKICQFHVQRQSYHPNYAWIGSKLATFYPTITNRGTTHLELGGPFIQCLCSVDEDPKPFPLPGPVTNLKKLSLGVDIKCEDQILFMITLLECCLTLRNLTITSLNPNESEKAPHFSEHREKWSRVTCMRDSLQKVELLGVMADAYELELTKFFLEKTKKLKCFKLQLNKKCGNERKTVTSRTVLSYDKASPSAKIVLQNQLGNPSEA